MITRLLLAVAGAFVVAAAPPGALRVAGDRGSAVPVRIVSELQGKSRVWLDRPARLAVRDEATGVGAEAAGARINALGLAVESKWTARADGAAWDLVFTSERKRTGYEVTVDLPVLAPGVRVFTPSNDGTLDVSARPTFRPVPYAHLGWESGQAYVLPLVSVMDPVADQALTIALPADAHIPHLQVEWIAARVLRLTLGHRAMGGGRPAALRLLFYAHPADYRSVLKAYASEFPAYFEPALPRGRAEGAFWYHHIHEHPDFEEMARQRVRFLWSSFWFTWLGDYLPDAAEWEPYTYARWWKLGRKMSDGTINAFIARMRDRGIGVYAYFNVTEYGGAGGARGDSAEAAILLKKKFAAALIKDEQGRDIPTWEGAMAMNPRAALPLWPVLEDQVRRHIARLRDFEGFVIDRLDWASRYDYGHDDGFSMIGGRPVENMAFPVGEAVRGVCRLAHQAGKRVFVNQFYRIEVLRDVDGYCHENDYVPALGYLSPYRPVSAWEMRTKYDGDLLAFEKQLKQRLQFAVFPQMIAKSFPISQQKPNERAAAMLETYAPLFDSLAGKRQVLEPHCVEAAGDNDVNLFVNGAGAYVAPLTSRTRHRSRSAAGTENVTVRLRVADAAALQWAHVCSADGASYRTSVKAAGGVASVEVPRHGTASVVIAGKGAEPPLK